MLLRISAQIRQRQNWTIPAKLHPTSSFPAPTRMQIVIWVVLLVVAVALSVRAYHLFQVGTYGDDAMYIVLARSLIDSDTYGLINVPGDQPEAAPFPFGYPLLLAPLALLFPNNFDALKILSIAATLLNATILFWGWPWFSRRSYWWAIAIVGLYTFSLLTIAHTRMVMAEPIFTTFCLSAMLLAEQAARSRQKWWGWLLLGVTLAFVMFTRSVGVTLVIVIFGYLLFARGREIWKQLSLVVATMLIIVGLIIGLTSADLDTILPKRYLYLGNTSFVVLQPPDERPLAEPHIVQPVEVAEAAENGMAAYLEAFFIFPVTQHLGIDLREALLPIGGGPREQAFAERIGIPFLPLVLGLVTFGLIVLGYTRWLAQEGLSVFNLFALFYFGAIFLWVWIGPRLLYPIQPQLFLGLLLGIEAILVWMVSSLSGAGRFIRFKTGALAAVVTFLILVSIFRNLSPSDTRLHVGDIQQHSQWLKSNTNASAVVMTEEPQIHFLYSGRKTVAYPTASTSASELEAYLLAQKVDYILVSPKLEWQPSYNPMYSAQAVYILPFIAHLVTTNRVVRVYTSEQDLIQVYKVRPYSDANASIR